MTAVLRDQVIITITPSIFNPLLCFFLFYFFQGIDAQYVSLEDIVPPYNKDLESGETLGQDFYDDLAVALGARLQECSPRVPVVTGNSPLNVRPFHHKPRFRFLWSCTRLSSKPSWSRLY